MNFGRLTETLQQAQESGATPQWSDLELSPGSREGMWADLQNVRLQIDGEHVFWKPRGGSEVKQTFFGNILTMHFFSATVDGQQKDYIVVHTATGRVYLMEYGNEEASTEIFANIFTTTQQIYIINNGAFLYLFDPDHRVYKVYDLLTDTQFDWLGNNSSPITSYEWITGDWNDDNIWGFRKGASILVLHKFQEGSYSIPGSDSKSYRMFRTRIDEIFPTYFTYSAPDENTYNSFEFPDLIGAVNASPDTVEDLEGYKSRFHFAEGDEEPTTNEDFIEPVVYRGYLVVDLMADGSFQAPGRPITVATTLSKLIVDRRVAIEINTPEPAPGVEKRFLYATRWQASESNIFTPSRPDYPNSAFFLAKPFDATQTTIEDRTPDHRLLEPLSSDLPLVGGILQMFTAGQLEPRSVSSHEGALLIGGYRINRPKPIVYDAQNPDVNGNAFYQLVGTGDPLTDDPEIAVRFEYTDGKKSEMIDTGHILTDAEEQIDGGSPATNAFVDFQATKHPDGPGEVEVRLESDTESPVTTNYSDTDSLQQVVSAMVDDVNASSLSDRLTASHAGAGDVIRITWDEEGDAGNQEEIRLIWSSSIEFENDGSGQLVKPLTGGSEETEALVRSGNRLQMHSLNALVSVAYILVKINGDYKIAREVPAVEGRFHGQVIYLPNSDQEVAGLREYNTPPEASILEQVDLFDHVVPAIPFQQPLIGEQSQIEEGAPITQIVATHFDADKSTLRFRLVIFTDRNIQIGYISMAEEAVQSNFEIVAQGVRLRHKFGARYVRGDVIYQAQDGIYMYSEQQSGKIVDKRLFEVLEKNLESAVYNHDHNEVWLIFRDSRVLVLDADGRNPRTFVWPSAMNHVRSGLFAKDRIVLGIGTNLFYGDDESLGLDDGEHPIVCKATTTYLGTPRQKSALHELLVYGDSLDVAVNVDLQKARKESAGYEWQKTFTSDFTISAKPATMYGQNYQINRHAPMPRIQLDFNAVAGGFIDRVEIKSTPTLNQGKAKS